MNLIWTTLLFQSALLLAFYPVQGKSNFSFLQPATGPDIVCVSSDVTINCKVQFTDNDSVTTDESAVWSTSGMVISNNNPPNHMLVLSGASVVGLRITNVSLELNSRVYTCGSVDSSITSDYTLNVAANETASISRIWSSEVSSTQFTVSWNVTDDMICDVNVEFTILLLSADGNETITTSDMSHTFTGLTNNTVHTVSVYGTNTAGRSEVRSLSVRTANDGNQDDQTVTSTSRSPILIIIIIICIVVVVVVTTTGCIVAVLIVRRKRQNSSKKGSSRLSESESMKANMYEVPIQRTNHSTSTIRGHEATDGLGQSTGQPLPTDSSQTSPGSNRPPTESTPNPEPSQYAVVLKKSERRAAAEDTKAEEDQTSHNEVSDQDSSSSGSSQDSPGSDEPLLHGAKGTSQLHYAEVVTASNAPISTLGGTRDCLSPYATVKPGSTSTTE